MSHDIMNLCEDALARAQQDRDGGAPSPVPEEIRVVLEINRALAGKLDLESVLGVAVGATSDLLHAQGSSVLLINPETQEMSFFVASGPEGKTDLPPFSAVIQVRIFTLLILPPRLIRLGCEFYASSVMFF